MIYDVENLNGTIITLNNPLSVKISMDEDAPADSGGGRPRDDDGGSDSAAGLYRVPGGCADGLGKCLASVLSAVLLQPPAGRVLFRG